MKNQRGAGWMAAGLLLCLAGAGATAGPESVVMNHIALRVGNEVITSFEIEEPLRQLRERLQKEFGGAELEKKMQQAREQHLKRLVEDKLVLLEAREQNYDISEAQIDERVKQEMETLRNQFASEKDFNQQLAKEHLTIEDLQQQRERQVREQLLRQRLLQTKLQEFMTGTDITDEQLQAYYAGHPDEFRRPARVRLRQIYIARPDPGLPEEEFTRLDDAARQRCEKALAEIRAGRDFAAVARRFSEHKATAEKGGEVGWIEPGEVGMPEFEQVVFQKLKPGQVSPIISTGRGYFIVQLEDSQEGGVIPLEEVRGRIRQQLMNQGSETRYLAWIETLKKKYKVTEEK